jgi:hypothetical protein
MSTLRTNEIKMLDDRGFSNFTFDSVADMQAASQLEVGQKVRTLGYYEPGDGGGNDYEIVAAGTGTGDGGSIIHLDDGVHQARGLFPKGHVWIEQFGANSDVDARPGVQSAVDFKESVGGGFVFAGGGTFEMSALGGQCISIPSGIYLFGSGRNITVFKRSAGAEGHVFNSDNKEDTGYSRITIDGNKEADTQGSLDGFHGIRHSGINGLTIDDVDVRNCIYYGLGLQGSSVSENVRVSRFRAINNGGWSNSGTGMGDGVDIKGSRNVQFSKCTAAGNVQKGFDIRCDGLQMSDCISEDNGGDGFTIRGIADFFGTEIVVDAELNNCTSRNNKASGNGFVVATFGTLSRRGDVIYTGCRAYNNEGHGFRANDNEAAISHSACHSKRNDQSGMRYADTDDVTVSGGQLFDNGGHGFDNGVNDRRHTVVGVAARGNALDQIRAPAGSLALHANNNTN